MTLTLPWATSGLEPGSNNCGEAVCHGSRDRGQAGYGRSDDDSQRSDDRNGVRERNTQGGHP